MDSEAELVARAAKGETEAFRKLYEAHEATLFRFAYRLTNARDVAEDLTQECFLRLMRAAGFDEERGSLRQFLYGMMRNLARQRQQANGREVNWDEDALGRPETAVAAGHDLLESGELAAIVHTAIATLPPLQREAIVLCELEELSLDEAAAVVGADVGALKSRLHRAREGLRRRLAPYRKQARIPLPRGSMYDSTE